MFTYRCGSSCILRKHGVQIMKVHRYANKTILSYIHSTQVFFNEVNKSNVLPSTSIRRSQVSYRKQIPFFETSVDILLPGDLQKWGGATLQDTRTHRFLITHYERASQKDLALLPLPLILGEFCQLSSRITRHAAETSINRYADIQQENHILFCSR